MDDIEKRRAAIREAIDKAGGIVAFRKALGVTHQGVYYWIKVGRVPIEKALEIEDKFGIPRIDLIDARFAAALQAPAATDLV